MQLRFPSKSWPKRAQNLYFGKFLPDYRSGQFIVDGQIFSNHEILDCLEGETESSFSQAKLMKQFLPDKKNLSVLIVGAGSGRLGTQIQKLFPKFTLTEVDKNPDVINRLHNKNESKLNRTALLGDASKLPLENNSIDVIICYSVFRYIQDIRGSLSEFMRVVKNGRTIIISEAKDRNTINKVKKRLLELNISYRFKIVPTIKLPHLTFFYYLVSKYDKDDLVKEMINQEMSEGNVSMVQAAFNLAGYSLGSIYALIWEK